MGEFNFALALGKAADTSGEFFCPMRTRNDGRGKLQALMRTRRAVRRRGISLLELLVTIAISATLLGALIPATQSARESSRQLQCKMKLRQLALGLSLYASDHQDKYPTNGPWVKQIRAYVEIDQSGVDGNHISQCPSTPGYPNYRNSNEGRDFSYPAELKTYYDAKLYEVRRGAGSIGKVRRITDGLSNTFLILEQAGPYGAYIGRPANHKDGPYPCNIPADDEKGYLSKSIWSGLGKRFIHYKQTASLPVYSGMQVNTNNKTGIYSFHPGAHAAMCDGSVHFLSLSTSPDINAARFTANDGDLVRATE